MTVLVEFYVNENSQKKKSIAMFENQVEFPQVFIFCLFAIKALLK